VVQREVGKSLLAEHHDIYYKTVGKNSTFDLLSVHHDIPCHNHLCRDPGMLTVHMIWLDLKVVRCDDIHLFHLDSVYSINLNLVFVEAEGRRLLKEDQTLGIGDLVEQSHTVVCKLLMKGSEEDLRMEMVRCMIGMDLKVEDEKLKQQKILVVAVEEHIDLLEGRGIQTSLVRYKKHSGVSSVCLHLSLLNLHVCWSLHLVR
jgi:hypothetical protein